MCVFSCNWLRMTKVWRYLLETDKNAKIRFFCQNTAWVCFYFTSVEQQMKIPTVTVSLHESRMGSQNHWFVNGESLHIGCRQALKTTSNLSPNYYIDLFFGTCLLSFDVLCLLCGNCYSICILLPPILSREVLNSNWIFLIK